MAFKKPIVITDGQHQRLQTSDSLDLGTAFIASGSCSITGSLDISESLNIGNGGIAPLSIRQDSTNTSVSSLNNNILKLSNFDTTSGNYSSLSFSAKDTGGTERTGAGVTGVNVAIGSTTVDSELALITRDMSGTDVVYEMRINKVGKISKYANSTPTDGQLLIGGTSSGVYSAATITAGTGISVTNGNNSITISATESGVTSVTGTANQITAIPTTGAVVLTTPQDIATTSSVTFNNITLSTSSSIGASTGTGTLSIRNDSTDTSVTSINNNVLKLSNFDTTSDNYSSLSFSAKDTGGTERTGAGVSGVFVARGASTVDSELSLTTRDMSGAAAVYELRINKSGKISKYANSTPTDGQLLIGGTSAGDFTKGTLTAGSGISVTNGNNSITIATKDQIANVKTDFGAVGDGVTNDSTAFQNAINSGKAIYVPTGNYLISNTLTITASGVTLFGDGYKSNLIIAHATSGIAVSGGIEALKLINLRLNSNNSTNTILSIKGVNNDFIIHGIYFANGLNHILITSNSSAAGSYGIHIDKCDFQFSAAESILISPISVGFAQAISITDCEFFGNIKHLFVSSGSGIFVDKCRFERISVSGSISYGIHVDTCNKFVLSNSYLEDNNQINVIEIGTSASGITIKNNYFTLNVSGSSTIKAVSTIASALSNSVYNISFIDNYLSLGGTLGTVIDFSDAPYVLCRNNTINAVNASIGISSSSSNDSTVKVYDNKFFGTYSTAQQNTTYTIAPDNIKIGSTALTFTKSAGGEAARFTSSGDFLIGVTSGSQSTISKSGLTTDAGNPVLYIGRDSLATVMAGFFATTVGQGSANAANAAMKLGSDGTTSRSLNTSGTINASGADYAEYAYKNATCGNIEKGQIIGFDIDGKITDKWDESIRFAIKSTAPCMVGGDVWGSFNITEDRVLTEEEQTQLEEIRQTVDRIAYSGIVPINVLNAAPGDYIVAINDNNNIVGVAQSSVTFEEYLKTVGRVNRILEDGRAEVAVIIH